MADTTKTTAEVKLNILEPRATEKTYRESMRRTYVFPVDRSMSKTEIAKLVEKEFSVSVTDVRTLTRKGKQTKYSKGKHQYPGITYRRDKKYAYVTLKEGDSIKVFEEQDNNNTSAKEAEETKGVKSAVKKLDKTEKSDESGKSDKADKSADKKAGKEKK